LNNFAGSWIFFTIFPKFPLIKPRFENIIQFAPLLGIFIGYLQCVIYFLLKNNSWPIYSCTSICLASGYLITGGLHLDGLMDTFDGLYAGKEKFIKAMKDSRVGAFGVQAIIFITLIQYGSLIKIEENIIQVLPICLFWGRFSILIYLEKFNYLCYERKSTSHKEYWRGFKKESILSLGILSLIIFYYLFPFTSTFSIIQSTFLIVSGLLCSYKVPTLLGKSIGGVNGDTCGASIVLTETLMILIHAIVL